MMLGLFWMIAANAACLLGAHALWRRCRTGEAGTDTALFLLIRFTLASGAVLVAGLAGCLNATALGLAGLAALGGLLLSGAHKEVRLPEARSLRGRVPPLLLAVAAIFLVRLLLQVWFLSPHVGDAVSYHLPKVAEWIQAGRITAETGQDYRAPFPGGFEFFEIWWCVFLHHDLLMELAGVELWAMAFAALFAVARWTGLTDHAAFLAALLFCATPVIVMQAVSCLNDLPVVALFLTSTALVLARAHPLLLLLPLGVGIGVKPTFGFAVPGLLVLWFLVRKEPAAPLPRLRPLAALALLSAGLGAYWYLRNWALYGNPIYPGTSRGFIQDQLVQQVGPNLYSLKESLRRLIDSRIYDSLSGYNAQCELAANWGPAVFAAGLPGLLLGLREGARFRILALGISVSAVAVLLLVLSDAWFTRFVLFVPALLCVSAARLGVSLRGVSLVLAALLGYQFVATLVTDRLASVGEYPAMYRQCWRERASNLLGDSLPREERAIASCGDGGYCYLLYGPDFSRKVHFIRTDKPEDLVLEMRRVKLGVIHGSGKGAALMQSAVQLKLLKPVGGNFFGLPEWRPAATSPSGTP